MRTLTRPLVSVFVIAILLGVAAVGTADLFRPSSEETKGTIADLVPTDARFVIFDQNGNLRDFEMLPDAKVTIDDVPASLENLRIGDRVRVAYIFDKTVLRALEVNCTRNEPRREN